jgi:hypothetical protein
MQDYNILTGMLEHTTALSVLAVKRHTLGKQSFEQNKHNFKVTHCHINVVTVITKESKGKMESCSQWQEMQHPLIAVTNCFYRSIL